MEKTVKITKKDFYGALIELVEGMETVGVYDAKDVQEFLEKQVAQIDAKAAKAKERAAKAKAEGDELTKAIEDVITAEFQTADAITEQVDFENVTKSKVVARLTKLVAAGKVVKEQRKVDDRKAMCYKFSGTDADAEAEDVAEDEIEE